MGYWLDSKLVGGSLTNPGGRWRVYAKDADTVMPGPSRIWVFIDEHPASINDGGFGFRMPDTLAATAQQGWVDYPAGLHNGAGSLSFIDGHSDIHRWIDRTSRRPGGLDSHVTDWWKPNLPAFIARRMPSRALDQLLEERAIEVLYEFGPAAAAAVPALIEVDTSLNDFVGFGSAGLAHATLLQIGQAGVPYLIKTLK